MRDPHSRSVHAEHKLCQLRLAWSGDDSRYRRRANGIVVSKDGIQELPRFDASLLWGVGLVDG